MNDAPGDPATIDYPTREVVGVFADEASLNTAVEQLGEAGIDRAAVSVLGTGAAPTPLRPAAVMADDPKTPQAAFVSENSQAVGRGAAMTVPMAIAGLGAAWAVAATGGALLLAIGAAAVAGAGSAGIGALLYRIVGRHHEAAIRAQIAQGGLILWVAGADTETEGRATAVLQRCGASSIHPQTIDRHWGIADSPLYGVQPDPFLQHDPRADGV